MKKNIFPYTTLVFWLVIFALITAVFAWIGPYNFCYLENWRTLFFDSLFVRSTLFQVGGLAQLGADFLIQFFTAPITGSWITALALTLIGLLMAELTAKLMGDRLLLPLALLPVVALGILHFNVNYLYTGTLAVLLTLGFLFIQIRLRNRLLRAGYSLVSSLLLFVVAGPVASLYTCALLLFEVVRNPKQSVFYLLLPLLVFLAGAWYWRQGYVGDLKQILLPDGYFTHRLHAGSIIYLPWVLVMAVLALACILRFVRLKSKWVLTGFFAVEILVLAGFFFYQAPKFIDKENEFFKELNYKVDHQQWDEVVQSCSKHPMTNLLYQNYLHLALAEKGALADSLFQHPVVDIQSIFVTGNKTPYVSTLLSDVFYSMGHIAYAQRYAFESNESAGNYSPRMLRRLVETNLIYGHYPVAKKYLTLLAKTKHYAHWAQRYSAFLWNDDAVEADSILGMKRKCLFSDNRLSGSKGLDGDLKQIIASNPKHTQTVQYLGSLYLLLKDLKSFRSLMDSYLTWYPDANSLPMAFQEGLLVSASDSLPNELSSRISGETIERYREFGARPSKQKNNLWYFLKFTN